MSYILRRPLFRRGGKADEGITSGLRPGYENGKSVEQQFLRTRDLINKYTPPPRNNLNQFLIDFGLNMASGSPSGNIIQTAAEQAKGPYNRFTQRRATADTAQAKMNQAIIGDIMAQEAAKDIAGIEAGGKSALKETEIEEKQIKQAYRDISDIREKLKIETDVNKKRILNAQLKGSIGVLTEILGVPAEYEAIISDEDIFGNFVGIAVEKENKRRVDEYKKNNPEASTVDIEENVELIDEDSADAVDLTFEYLRKKYSYQKGGRVGKVLGGPMVKEQLTESIGTPRGTMTMQDTMVEKGAPNPDSPVQNLSYNELRARLPAEISDDVVNLLANSEQALIEFANIQTQQDVDAFNQKYDVELVLPAEA